MERLRVDSRVVGKRMGLQERVYRPPAGSGARRLLVSSALDRSRRPNKFGSALLPGVQGNSFGVCTKLDGARRIERRRRVASFAGSISSAGASPRTLFKLTLRTLTLARSALQNQLPRANENFETGESELLLATFSLGLRKDAKLFLEPTSSPRSHSYVAQRPRPALIPQANPPFVQFPPSPVSPRPNPPLRHAKNSVDLSNSGTLCVELVERGGGGQHWKKGKKITSAERRGEVSGTKEAGALVVVPAPSSWAAGVLHAPCLSPDARRSVGRGRLSSSECVGEGRGRAERREAGPLEGRQNLCSSSYDDWSSPRVRTGLAWWWRCRGARSGE